MTNNKEQITIIGCGNLNRSDDAVGVIIAQRLQQYVTKHPHPNIQVTNWRILQKIVPMATLLHKIVSSAKIRVCPPESQGMPFEMRVDELSVYKDWA